MKRIDKIEAAMCLMGAVFYYWNLLNIMPIVSSREMLGSGWIGFILLMGAVMMLAGGSYCAVCFIDKMKNSRLED